MGLSRDRGRPPLLLLAALATVTTPTFCTAQSDGYNPIFTEEMLQRRTISRFVLGHEDNNLCWNRSVHEDGFISPIDGHNHIRPFGGPPVPWQLYLEWMKAGGNILPFSRIFIGEKFLKS